MRLSTREWVERAVAAGLRPLFDIEGRPEGAGDDDAYDAVERQMRAEGRDPDPFADMRPPRAEGWAGALPPNEYIQGGDGFELRVAPDGEEIVAGVLRAGAASLANGREGLVAKGSWREVDRRPLLDAVAAIFGEVPPYDPPPPRDHVFVARGGRCDACGEAVEGDALTVSIYGEEEARWQGAEVARLHLGCAHRFASDRVTALLTAEPTMLDRFADLFDIDRGKLVRCRVCSGIVKKPEWRLVAPWAKEALHLECAVSAAPAGFRDALLAPPVGFDPAPWLARV